MKPRFLSLVLPDRISSPISRMAAVGALDCIVLVPCRWAASVPFPHAAVKAPPVRTCRARQSCLSEGAMTYVKASDSIEVRNGQIKLHGPEAFEGMRKAGKLTAQALDLLVGAVNPGVTTETLDRMSVEFARDHGAIPASLN